MRSLFRVVPSVFMDDIEGLLGLPEKRPVTRAKIISALTDYFEVVRIEYVNTASDGGNDFWWGVRCKRKCTQRKWDISMGGDPTEISVLTDAYRRMREHQRANALAQGRGE